MKIKGIKFLKSLLFLLIITLTCSKAKSCPNFSCGKNNPPIKYPFTLEGQHPQICNEYISLRCTPEKNTILNIPFSGDFYVFDILYVSKFIVLYDPEDCLPRRLMNLNLSSSPFQAIEYQSYTFYSCPAAQSLITDGFKPIDCLSDYPNATVASSSVPPDDMMQLYNCSVIVQSEIPVLWFGQYDSYGILSDLTLGWDFPSCIDCEDYGPRNADKPWSKLSKFIGSNLFIPVVIIAGTFFSISVFVCFKRGIALINRASELTPSASFPEVAMAAQTTTAAAVLPPGSTGGATTCPPDSSKMKTYTVAEFLEENMGSLGPDQGTSCTICLEEYVPQDTIRCIILCQHYFHASCIDQWFGKNVSCPVCRSSLSNVQT